MDYPTPTRDDIKKVYREKAEAAGLPVEAMTDAFIDTRLNAPMDDKVKSAIGKLRAKFDEAMQWYEQIDQEAKALAKLATFKPQPESQPE